MFSSHHPDKDAVFSERIPGCCARRATPDRRRRPRTEIAVKSGGHNVAGKALCNGRLVIAPPALSSSAR